MLVTTNGVCVVRFDAFSRSATALVAGVISHAVDLLRRL